MYSPWCWDSRVNRQALESTRPSSWVASRESPASKNWEAEEGEKKNHYCDFYFLFHLKFTTEELFCGKTISRKIQSTLLFLNEHFKNRTNLELERFCRIVFDRRFDFLAEGSFLRLLLDLPTLVGRLVGDFRQDSSISIQRFDVVAANELVGHRSSKLLQHLLIGRRTLEADDVAKDDAALKNVLKTFKLKNVKNVLFIYSLLSLF